MTKIFHFFGAHQSVLKFQIAVGATAALFLLITGVYWTGFSQVAVLDISPAIRYALFWVFLLAYAGIVAGGYRWFLSALATPLEQTQVLQLTADVVEHYKSMIKQHWFNKPITWLDLYEIMQFLRKVKIDALASAQKEAACSQQKNWISDRA